MIIVGIDPGLSGGIAAVSALGMTAMTVMEAIDVPTSGEAAKRRVDVGAVLAFLQRHRPSHAFIERAQAMPDQGASSGFHYGRAVGALEACLDGMLVPTMIIEATAWKKAHGLIKCGKEDSRQRAIKLFPGTPYFARKKDHNRAEAALMAWYGIMLMRGSNGPRPQIDRATVG